jgi:hypothetical protein
MSVTVARALGPMALHNSAIYSGFSLITLVSFFRRVAFFFGGVLGTRRSGDFTNRNSVSLRALGASGQPAQIDIAVRWS